MAEKRYTTPVFIGGFPSGGTDLLKTILNAHPEIYINGEMPFLFNLEKYGVRPDHLINSNNDFKNIKSIAKAYDIWGNLEGLRELSYSDFENSTVTINEFFRKAFNNKNSMIWGNKTPQNTENIEMLTRLFPQSKFIIIIRDIRDTTLSWRNKWGKSMYLTAHKWNKRLAGIEQNDHILCVKFEDLLDDLESTTKIICSFLAITWNERMLRHSKYVDKPIDGKINYGKGVLSENKEKWKTQLTDFQIKRIEEIAFDTLKLHGYNVQIAKEKKVISTLEKGLGIAHDVFATFFVGNRQAQNNSITHRIKSALDQVKYRMGIM